MVELAQSVDDFEFTRSGLFASDRSSHTKNNTTLTTRTNTKTPSTQQPHGLLSKKDSPKNRLDVSDTDITVSKIMTYCSLYESNSSNIHFFVTISLLFQIQQIQNHRLLNNDIVSNHVRILPTTALTRSTYICIVNGNKSTVASAIAILLKTNF